MRFRAISCLQALVRFNSRLFYNHWALFLPSSAALQQQQQISSSAVSPLQSATIFTLLKSDPIVKVRAAALSFLAAILDGSKPFWLAADEGATTKPSSNRTGRPVPQTTSFISFSATLVSMVKDTHQALGQYLSSSESVVACTVLALKALALLFANAPYERLAPGLAAGAVGLLVGSTTTPPSTPLIDSTHIPVRIATLSCLASLFSSHGPLADVRAILFENSAPNFIPLIARLKALCGDPAAPHLRAEALACLAALSKPYFSHVQTQWSSLFASLLLPSLLGDSDSQV